MPIFNNKKKSIFFIHIPRTGGRYISTAFMNSGFDIFFNEGNLELPGEHVTYEVRHVWYPLYTYLPIQDALHFTVVRNPLDRFKSAAKGLIVNCNLDKDYFSRSDFVYDDLCDIISYATRKKGSAWYTCQFNFVTDKTLIWKYEDGFGKDFKKWIWNNMRVRLNLKDISYEGPEWEKMDVSFSPEVEEMVKKYYQVDYKTFDYLK